MRLLLVLVLFLETLMTLVETEEAAENESSRRFPSKTSLCYLPPL